MENTQVFFILQSLLWSNKRKSYNKHLETPTHFNEGIDSIDHIPWWTICLSPIPTIDVAFMNNIMFELSKWAF